ncbi:MAG: sulfotransferase domain-containing protein [Bacteroidia bacterium]
MSEKDKHVISFIGIGAQKSGTTWLSERLSELPGVSTPPIKELHYFDRDESYPSINALAEKNPTKRMRGLLRRSRALDRVINRLKGLTLRKALFLRRWYFCKVNDKWYLGLFKTLRGIRGEITPAYSILKPEDIRRMFTLAPHARIIFILRNPIDRAWSHYRHVNKTNRKFKFKDEPVQNVIKFMDSNRQHLRNNYIRTIDEFAKIYPKKQILVCFYDSITDHPKKLLAEVTNFIGADSKHIDSHCNLNARANVSPNYQMPDIVRNHLKMKYKDMMETLSIRYGGYCTKWYAETYPEEDVSADNLGYGATVDL